MYAGFEPRPLDEQNLVHVGRLPEALIPDEPAFQQLWDLHPPEYPEILMHGRMVRTPRWVQSYGRDYRYPGQDNAAILLPDSLRPYLTWAQSAIDERLSGLLLNWYDGALGHYIGKHRDRTGNLIRGTPIVTISLGQERIFRLRPWRGGGGLDIQMSSGTVVVMPWVTNQNWTHEVPRSTRYTGRRISVTVRAFRK